MTPGTTLRALGALSIGAIASMTAGALLKSHPPGGNQGWARTNYAGNVVTLLEGPVFVVGAVAGATGVGTARGGSGGGAGEG